MPRANIFLDRVSLARGGGGGEEEWGGGLRGEGGAVAKARIFMPGKHANYAKRVIPSWAGSQNSESAPRPEPPPPRWQCHCITMRGLPLRDAPSSLRLPAGPPAPLLPTPAHLENPLAAGELLGFQSGSRCELGAPALPT